MSNQRGPKTAPGQHSAHILLGFILREHQSTTASFLDFVGEGKIVVRWRRCELCREARNRYLPGKVRKAVAYV